MIVVLNHREGDDVVSCARHSVQALNHWWASHVGQVTMDRQVGVVLELELRLLHSGHLVWALA